jgi:hypothetical protein
VAIVGPRYITLNNQTYTAVLDAHSLSENSELVIGLRSKQDIIDVLKFNGKANKNINKEVNLKVKTNFLKIIFILKLFHSTASTKSS